MIKEFAAEGESYLEIETPEWKGRMILSVGSILLELTEKKSGLNLLRSPETIEDLKFQPEVYGFPVLIPPNCIYKGLFSWRGRQYHLPVNNRFGNHIVEDLLGIDVDYYFEILPLDIQEEYRRKNKSNCITLFYEVGELFHYLDDRARHKELYKLFWENERPVSEPRIQLILGCIIDAFFHFLFHRNAETDEKVLVEVKCASSIAYLRHGFEKQLVAYLLSSKYRHAFYLIACFTDEEYALTKKFIAENVYTEEIQLYVNIRILDLRKRPTASAL